MTIPTDLEKVNPRYKAYCLANGVTSPAQMWAQDGNTGWKFILWNNAMLNTWFKENGKTKLASDSDHEQYTNWLLTKGQGEGR